MSNRDIPNVNPVVLAILPELMIVEIRAQVRDDAIGEALVMDDLIKEVKYFVCLWPGH